MKTHLLWRRFVGGVVLCALFVVVDGRCDAQPIEFADNGGLKMLYDNRMYPQAVTVDGKVYMVWRGDEGYPYIRSYDLEGRTLGEPYMLLTGMEAEIDSERYRRDHHFAPVIWADGLGRLHVLFGCHSKWSGVHLVAKARGEMRKWRELGEINTTVSYPKVHRIAGGKTLIYFRDEGHLGSWQYRISSDEGETWERPGAAVVDMDAKPHDAEHASYAGSYHTTRVSADGKTLHVAFIWKVEDPVFNTRYQRVLGDHTQRYNLHYLKVDLASGKAFNDEGKELELPVRKSTADRDCQVWDTEERVAAVGPSIYLGEDGEPYMVLPVSGDLEHESTFYFVRRGVGAGGGGWDKTAIVQTPHPFNASHLFRGADGRFRVYLLAGEGENASEEEMDNYGWGDRLEEWVGDASGEHWKRVRDLTPGQDEAGWRYQNVKFVTRSDGTIDERMLMFYGWRDAQSSGKAYLLDGR